jgi:hypothetical protein
MWSRVSSFTRAVSFVRALSNSSQASKQRKYVEEEEVRKGGEGIGRRAAEGERVINREKWSHTCVCVKCVCVCVCLCVCDYVCDSIMK